MVESNWPIETKRLGDRKLKSLMFSDWGNEVKTAKTKLVADGLNKVLLKPAKLDSMS